MKRFQIVLLFMLASQNPFCQEKTFEIYGRINGEYNSRMYLFFDGNYRQKDSISCKITGGRFYFKVVARLPIQARLHMDQESFIRDVYIDNAKTYIDCTTKMKIFNKGQDTMNMLTVTKVTGSQTDKLKSNFETWSEELKKSSKSDEEKRKIYFQRLYAFIKKHQKNKVSLYLLGKASTLFYSQIKELNVLADTSLNNSFEAKGVKNLLNRLDKSENSAIGVQFKDFNLKDSNNIVTNTKKFRGKYTLIVCWASWCKPCRMEHPDLRQIYNEYKNSSIQLLGVSFDKDREKWIEAILKDSLSWPQLIDLNSFNGEFATYYGIEAIPTNFLIDKDGKVIAKNLTLEEIKKTLKELL